MVTANRFSAETANAKKEILMHLMNKTLIKTLKDLASMLQWLTLREHQRKDPL
jgi:hypothetical protein